MTKFEPHIATPTHLRRGDLVEALHLTCFACPTQLEGHLPEVGHIYFRYRYSHYTVSVDGRQVSEGRQGDDLAGLMSFGDAVDLIADALGVPR